MQAYPRIHPTLRQIEEYSESLRASIQSHNEEQRKAEQKRYKLVRVIGWVYAIGRNLVKTPIYVSDLPELPADLQYSEIKKKTNRIIDHILRNKQKYLKAFWRISHVFGLYDHIIKKIVRKDVIILRVYELIFGVLLSIAAYVLMFIFESFAYQQKDNLLIVTVAILGGMFNSSAILLVSVKITKRKNRIKQQTHQAMQMMIYEKLNISDSYFLENSDNNMIYKLLYLEFEDYIKYAHNTCQFYRIGPMLLLFGFSIYLNSHRTVVSFYLLMLVKLVGMFVLEVFRRRHHQQYKYINFEMRKSLYELVKNFKSFTLKNLQGRYTKMFDRYLELKKACLKKIRMVSHLDQYIFYLSIVGLIGSELLAQFFMTSAGAPSQTLSTPSSRISLANPAAWNNKNSPELIIPLLSIMVFIEHLLSSTINSLSTFFNYKSSKEIYDKFFDNDFVISSQAIQQDSNLPKGEVQISDCEILERDASSINRMLDYLMHKSEYKKSDLAKIKTLRESTSLMRPAKSYLDSSWLINAKPSSSSKLSSVELILLSNHHNSKPHMLSRLKCVFSEVNLNIPPESRVCILESTNKTCTRAFIKLLLGESFINRGSLSHNSSFSYFNPNKMHFLVGMSIRDNILFGQEYNSERYLEILKLLNLQFGNYHGYDFYQISEQATNLKTDDRRLILMARFLYRESDIYIIEEYFNKINISLTLTQIKTILNNRLKHKTVIYVTSNEEMIALSDILVKFDEKNKMTATSSAKYLEESRRTKHGLPPASPLYRTDHKGQVLNTKLKNAVFVSNVTFEEELNIHRKLEERKAEIESMKKNRNNIFELLSYGIYLTNKRRQEGVNLDEPASIPYSTFRRMIKLNLRGCEEKQRVLLILLVYMLSILLHLLCEVFIFVELPKRNDKNARLQSIGFSACFFVFSIMLRVVRTFILEKYVSGVIDRLNRKLIDSLLAARIGSILKKKTHNILEKFSSELTSLEYNMLENLHGMFDAAVKVLVFSALFIYIYSLMIPLLIICIAFYCSLKVWKSLMPCYFRFLGLRKTIATRTDGLNFQLLKLIEGYRVNGTMEKLRKRQNILSEIEVRASQYCDVEFKLMIFKILFTGYMILGGLGLFLPFLYEKYPILNLFSIENGYFKWSFLIWTRVIIVSSNLFMNMLSFVQPLVCLFKIQLFVEDLIQNKNSGPAEIRMLKSVPLIPDSKSIVSFKNVSLTLGYQPILKKISFKIRRNEAVALFGIEGGGRSTIFELITNIIKRDHCKNSEIIIFSKKIEELNEQDIKSNIFLVERNPILFEGVVKDNIDPYGSINSQAIVDLLKEFNFKEISRGGYDRSGKHLRDPSHFFVGKKVSIFESNLHQNSIEKGKTLHSFVPESEILSRPISTR